ncbi:NAD(+)/NADH kinase [Hespellia stercorisuis]|uniref:NAD kinase n=1 Tax=Hespellia stercorisuis DSM 15480 TaxID=1121950 RepID=A0A1M6HMR5_9FIRM|nr:NAD(+)/NADH kinase [Hespellia stercorisuis]SHJ23480.1 NAD+ kinase [Hespellia stercorisuis DSM 15480]
MDKFYVITNTMKDVDYKVTNDIKAFIESAGKTCIIGEKEENGHIVKGTVPDNMDCAIILGGDGTMIQAARELRYVDYPLLGINMGTLGYLTEVEVQDAKKQIESLFSTDPVTEKRMMLQAFINQEREEIALNDVVVSRRGGLRILQFDIYVNGDLLDSYQADGVIVSTPTGSTGYNLSAGGPVVEPTASLVVITPICAHALNTGSVVLSAEDTIEIQIAEGRYGKIEDAAVSFDGTDMIALQTGDRVTIQKAAEVTKLVKLNGESFLKTMRRKMKGN